MAGGFEKIVQVKSNNDNLDVFEINYLRFAFKIC